MKKYQVLKRVITVTLLLFGLAPCCPALGAGQASTNYRIVRDVMGSGGGSSSSTGYSLQATLGQPSAIGISSSATYSNHAGFWHYMIALGDLNGDGTVGLEDVIYGLEVLTGGNPGELCREADVDGDGKIGMAEVVYILQKTGQLR